MKNRGADRSAGEEIADALVAGGPGWYNICAGSGGRAGWRYAGWCV